MSQSSTTRPRSTRKRRFSKALYIGLAILGLIFVTLVVVPVMMSSGQHYGQEFSPDDFSRRSYSYQVLPILNRTVTGIQYTSVQSDIGSELVLDGWIKPTGNQTKSWHLLWDGNTQYGYGTKRARDCDAHLLTDFLDKEDEDGNIWSTWNNNFAGNAKVFWPILARMARDEMYLKTPKVMYFALKYPKDDPKAFEKELHQLVSDAYLELGQLDLEMGLSQRGKQRIETSLEFNENEKAQSLLDTL